MYSMFKQNMYLWLLRRREDSSASFAEDRREDSSRARRLYLATRKICDNIF